MKNALLFSAALVLVFATACLAAEERSVSGVIKSIDTQALIVTLQDDASYPLKADADATWLEPGKNVDLLCTYDAGVVVDCGVGIGNIPEEAHNTTPAQPEIAPDLDVGEKQVDGLPEDLLPDAPTYQLESLLRSLDGK